MEGNTLAVITRTELKKTANKNLRKQGNIPAVVYGHGSPKHIVISEREFEKKFHKVSENTIITLIENNKEIANVLLKDYQEDLTTQRIAHIDFFEVEKDRKLKTKVPVHVTGNSIGVKAGGIMEQLAHDVEVECLPGDIPEKIIVNIDKLDIGQSIHLKDLEKISGVKFLGVEESVIVHVVHAKAAAAAEETLPAEGEAAPAAAGTAATAAKDKE